MPVTAAVERAVADLVIDVRTTLINGCYATDIRFSPAIGLTPKITTVAIGATITKCRATLVSTA